MGVPSRPSRGCRQITEHGIAGARLRSRNRGVFELWWSFELTMLASLGAEWLWLAR